MRSFLGRDILSLKDFERMEYFRVFQVCEDLKPYARDRRNGDLLKEKTLVTAFYQPSTRTRLATEAAMHRLGGGAARFFAPAEAARWASVPVINCGDGWGEPPTQFLSDLYAIWSERGSVDGLKVLCVG